MYRLKNALNALTTKADSEVSQDPKVPGCWSKIQDAASRTWSHELRAKFSSHHVYLSIRFQGIYEIFTEIRALWCTNLLQNSYFYSPTDFTVSEIWKVKIDRNFMRTKFSSFHVCLSIRFQGIYKIFTEIGALWCTNL